MELHLAPEWAKLFGPSPIRVTLPRPANGAGEEACPVGSFAQSDGLICIASHKGEPVVVLRKPVNSSRVYSCGFPLGFRYLWRESEPEDPSALNSLFGPMLGLTGIEREFGAPPHLGVHVSRAGKLLLFKERYGVEMKRMGRAIGADMLLISDRLGDAVYTDVRSLRERDGTTWILGGIKPYTAKWAEKVADVSSSAGAQFTVRDASIEGLPASRIAFTVDGTGRFRVRLALPPATVATVRFDGGMRSADGKTSLQRVVGGQVTVKVKGSGSLDARVVD